MTKKNLVLLAVAVAAGGGALFSANRYVEAASTKSDFSEAIATKLNVNANDVEAAIESVREEHRTEMKANMKTRYEERLTEAVADGEITEEQKAKLLSKFDEVQTKMDAIHDQMETLRDETETWAEENNIDSEFLMGAMGGGHMMKMHGGPARGMHF